MESIYALVAVLIAFIVGIFFKRKQDPTLDADTQRLRDRAKALEQQSRERVANDERIAEANRELEEIANEREADESGDHALADDVAEWNDRFAGGAGDPGGDAP